MGRSTVPGSRRDEKFLLSFPQLPSKTCCQKKKERKDSSKESPVIKQSMNVFMCEHACGGQRSLLVLFLFLIGLHVRQGLSPSLGIMNSARLAGSEPRDSSSLCLPGAGITGCRPQHLAFLFLSVDNES